MNKFEELPHDDAMERGFFSVLLFTSRFQDVVDLLSPDDFFVETHRQIFQAMIELFNDGKEIDIPNLSMQLKKSGINVRQAMQVVSEALNDDIRDHHLFDYAKEIKNKSLLRQIIRMSKSHVYTGQLEGTNAQELLTQIEKDTLDIVDKTVDVKSVDASGIIKDVQDDIDKGIKNGWHGYDTGFSKLDESTGGFLPSQVWVIGAYTGVGKTFLILQMLLNVLKQGGRVILFSTEMDRKLNILRMLGNLAELGTIQMMRNKLVDHQIEAMNNAKKTIASYGKRLLIYDNVYTVDEIRLKVKKAQLSGSVNVIAIDYLQNLKGKGSIYERMSEASTELYRMTQELRITTIIGSQVSQESAGWKTKESIDFKGAGEIAAVSDVALWIKKVDKGDREILMRKVRHGSPDKVYTRLEFPSGRFVDTDPTITPKENDDIKEQISE